MKDNIKGVILAGGLGTRLHPLTHTTNKHLLPVYDKHMIMFPIETLHSSGVKDILIITNKHHVADFQNLLGPEDPAGLNISYEIQENPKGGIADALKIAKNFVVNNHFAVLLGDNIFEDILNLDMRNGKTAKVFIKEVKNIKELGAAELKNGELVNIIEKPKTPPSNFAVLGAYVYPPDVFNVIDGLKPSGRGELEVTDINNYYAAKGQLDYGQIQGFWQDAGTFEGLFRSSEWRKRSRF
jgi:glucose-1-phosphate thymidylyltransferase